MVNYGNGKIYKIESITGEGKVYVGSTTKKYLSQRMDEHRRNHKYKELGTIVHSTGRPYPNIRSSEIFKLYGVDNCHIVLLESVNGECKEDLLKREAHYITLLDCVNKTVPLRTQQERNTMYYETYKDIIIEKSKEYYNNNKEVINKNQKVYYIENKEVLNEKNKEYYDNNRDIINEKRRVQYECECKKTYTIPNKSKHLKSKSHKLYMTSKLIQA